MLALKFVTGSPPEEADRELVAQAAGCTNSSCCGCRSPGSMVFSAETGYLRVLSEEALILTAVADACVLLVLGVLELMWPTTRPRRSPRARSVLAPPRPILPP